jgi:hypothetical protein
MGGIDEVALDRLSFVTEIAKHIRIKSSQNQTFNAELGQYSPFFLWLLRVSHSPCVMSLDWCTRFLAIVRLVLI